MDRIDLTGIFSLQAGKPWLFTNGNFVIFLILFMFVYGFTSRNARGRTWTMLGFSLLFYLLNAGWFFWVILFSGIINWLTGRQIHRCHVKWKKQVVVFSGIVINLAVLAIFKYSDMFGYILRSWISMDLSLLSLAFPVGLSYYTFCNISYLIDIRRGKVAPEKSLAVYLAYISFFPMVQMGPIERAGSVLPKFREGASPSPLDIREGTLLIANGLIKKMIIGDYLNHHLVMNIFSAPERFTGLENLVATLGYSLVIYCDFSGYTDISRGLARWFGFTPALNFNLPYKSRNIGEFWRRWHISLSSWLRDYLFMPMALKLSKIMKSDTVMHFSWLKSEQVIFWLATIVTFLACGIWHGTGMNFVIWGLMHGIALSIWKSWNLATKSYRMNLRPFRRALNQKTGIVLTFIFVNASWIIFRMPDMDSSLNVFRQIAFNFHPEAFTRFIIAYYPPLLMMVAGYTWHFLPDPSILDMKSRLMKLKLPVMVFLTLLLVVMIWYFQSLGSSQPIYINF